METIKPVKKQDRSKSFQMTLDPDIRYRAEKLARRKTLSLSRFINLVLSERLDQEDRLAHAA